jgi:hypothetical protein
VSQKEGSPVLIKAYTCVSRDMDGYKLADKYLKDGPLLYFYKKESNLVSKICTVIFFHVYSYFPYLYSNVEYDNSNSVNRLARSRKERKI